jgi:hypothetical protein
LGHPDRILTSSHTVPDWELPETKIIFYFQKKIFQSRDFNPLLHQTKYSIKVLNREQV